MAVLRWRFRRFPLEVGTLYIMYELRIFYSSSHFNALRMGAQIKGCVGEMGCIAWFDVNGMVGVL